MKALFFVLMVMIVCTEVVIASDGQREYVNCDSVEIDSAGVHGFIHHRIDGVIRGHGLSGIAMYVAIIPPRDDGLTGSDISELIIMADVGKMEVAICEKLHNYDNARVSCAQSIPGSNLKLIVLYEGADPLEYVGRMPAIMNYVAREVICY